MIFTLISILKKKIEKPEFPFKIKISFGNTGVIRETFISKYIQQVFMGNLNIKRVQNKNGLESQILSDLC